jgi:RAB protein geranylgeranyltransferase component A
MSMTVERIPSTLLGNLGLQPHYELVVVGTSLSESIVAAAASATGTSVLHLDANDYYGGLDDATFRFDDIVQWAQQLEASQENDNIKSRMEEGELVEGELLHTIATALATARMTEETCSEGEVDEGSGVNETDGERAKQQALDPEAVESEATKLRPRLRLHRLNTVPTQAVRLISYTKEDKISGETDTNSKDVTPEDIAASAAPAAPVALSTTKQVDDGTEIAENTTEQTVEDTKSPLVSLETLRAKSRYFCLDLMPRAVLCAGGLVELMISSGVGRYLDFLSMEAICILEEEGKRRRLEKRTSRATQGSSHLAGPENGGTSPPYHIWQVPCSKSDIFSSKELPRTEKLVLMKFLRFCLDWGTKHVEGSTVEAQDDRQLTNTRALNRPQSLSSSGGDLRASGSGGSKSAEVLANEFLEVGEGQSFADFLALWKLPARLQHAVIYAIAMLPVDAMKISAQEGLEAIFAHLSSLGQYGETAFLTAMYGTSEIAQAFCRLCAVGCGTYVLRQCPYAAVLLADNTDAREDGDVSSPSNRDGMEVVGVCDRSGGLVSCSRLVCASDYCPATTKGSFQQWTVRRIVVLDRPARDDAGRFIAVFNPRTVGIGNQGPIYAIHLDESA